MVADRLEGPCTTIFCKITYFSIHLLLYGIIYFLMVIPSFCLPYESKRSSLRKNHTMNSSVEKLVIVGSGPAGLTAGLYAARSLLSPLVLEGKEPGGQLMGTSCVENWPGEISILGPTLMNNIRKHALQYGCKIASEELEKADLSTRPFQLTTRTQKK